MAAPKPKRGTVFVPVGPIPRFRVLSDIDRRAERDAQVLLSAVMKQIRSTVADAPEDPADEALALAGLQVRPGEILEASTRTEPLSKSPGAFDPADRTLSLEEARGLSLIAHELRKRHGAPVLPGGLVDGDTVPASPGLGGDQEARREAVARILAALPFRSGRLVPEAAEAVALKAQAPEPLAEPITIVDEVHFATPLRAVTLRRILLGEEAPVVKAIRHPLPGQRVYTVTEGGEHLLASRLLLMPAIDAEVVEPRRVGKAKPSLEPATSIRSALRMALPVSMRYAYTIPPALEPVAELARLHSIRAFRDAYQGRPGEEEIHVRRRADILNASRDRVWMAIFRAARMAGLETEGARRRANASQEFRRANSTWRAAERRAARAEEQGHALRERFRLAKALARNIARELSLPTRSRLIDDPMQLWFHARRGPDVFTEDELVDAVPEEVRATVEASRELPRQVSEARFPNMRNEGAPVLLLDLGPELPQDEPPPSEREGPVLMVGREPITLDP